jgi:2-polyprenyl-3-methyl-5-hydroxy-6-metoxy-1,4-benzoquinol methylase
MGFSVCDGATRLEPAFPRIDWEEIACPLCGGTDHAHKIEAPEPAPAAAAAAAAAMPARWFLVVECRHCGLCFTNPRPTADSCARLFPPRTGLASQPSDPPPRPWRRPRIADPLAPVWTLVEHGRLLDVGLGVGSFLRRLYECGRPFTAVNQSTAAAAFMRQMWGVTAMAGSLPHSDLSGDCFDVITCMNTLEQFAQPLQVLRAARQLLVPGGVLVVAVPNMDGLPFRWFGRDWPGLDLPRHLTHFTPRTLRLMLQQANLRVHRMTAVRHSGWLRRAAGHSGLSAPWGRFLKGKAVASLASWYTALVRRPNGILAVALR